MNITLFLEGVCVIIAFLTLITKNLHSYRKLIAIFLLEANSALLLLSEWGFHLFIGRADTLGWWMVRITKFGGYYFCFGSIHCLNFYLKEWFKKEVPQTKVPRRLHIGDIAITCGVIVLIISQWTGWSYTFDEFNNYYRQDGRIFLYIFPLITLALQLSCVFQYYNRFNREVRIPLLLFIMTPIIAAFVQFFVKGLFMTAWSSVGMAIAMYVFTIQEMNKTIEHAHRMEVEMLERYKMQLEQTVDKRTHELRIANEKAEQLLLNILPEDVARELTENPGHIISKKYPNTTVLFTDIVGFTKMSSVMTAEDTVTMLNRLTSLFDERAEREGIEKIKTIGDAYMAASGLSENAENDGAMKMIRFAQGLLEDVRKFNETYPAPIQIRIGINSGELVAGVIGKTKFIYDVWGDTVNVASRMETTGEPMKIHISEETYIQTKNAFTYHDAIQLEVKGKGLMNGYFL
ncbi:MAG: adenylate/guanylate cyclase domain-containing protein [Spirochaetales bacterium]|nr:adenylate/guanylate cyclase domain-containing protein [Spirochaetales bacterium]